ncbi:cytochrome c [Leptospira wolffii]|uniref:Nitric oxide reductase n=1 Tax=Leptospira wolffii TaxID=409998 RepID=A0A2M9Z7B2_9LEPT|nr:c-type cytochrome [Leptospira wolffii]PJZ64257.1 nitric oxide reductase [Leptospira wolffii]TGK55947.1 cytochrome c [Leptospira wolffii]TGK68367.1 cytochrome c [Leptospira wolffii]TGK71993.1 cytochrome c [Leptospira wolffii]TGL27570.1 cytochrome c [Leptospira wolffii]
MLTKFQAKLFFLLGTFLFSAVFLALTYDSLKYVYSAPSASTLSEEVIRGKEIWEKNNCMGCHTILGEGAYYAPELTKVYERRGAEWIRVFLRDPQAMYPGERKMVKYNFSEAEISDVIAFLKWNGELDLKGFPPKAEFQSSTQLVNAASAAIAQPEKFKQICVACHSVGGAGGNVGPALDSVGKKYDVAYLENWLRDPQKIKPGTAMPKLPLSDKEITDLSSYLSQLK